MTALAATANAKHQYSTFWLGGLFFAIDVDVVQEVARQLVLTPVPVPGNPAGPTAAGAVRGLVNLRGQVVTAIDVRRQLGLPGLTDGRRQAHLVVRTPDGPVSLLVDRVGDVIEVEGDPDPPPETLRGVAMELVCGVHQLHHQLLLVLDGLAVASTGTATPSKPTSKNWEGTK